MSEHVATRVEVRGRDGDHVDLAFWCSCEPEFALVRVRAQVRPFGTECSRPTATLHRDRRADGHPDLCWSVSENGDGTLSGDPSVNAVPHFHTTRPWTLPLGPLSK